MICNELMAKLCMHQSAMLTILNTNTHTKSPVKYRRENINTQVNSRVVQTDNLVQVSRYAREVQTLL